MRTIQAMSLTEKDLIEAVVSNLFMVDYGYINKVNPDGSVNVTHSALSVTVDGEVLGETTTDNVEVLTASGAGFSLKWDYKAGDRVLLFGLKNYVPRTAEVSAAKKPEAFFHYSRSTLKAVPLCTFSEDAGVRAVAEEGSLALCAGKKIEINGSDLGGLVNAKELKKQLDFLTQRVDAVIDALKNSPTGAQDGGAAYKAAIALKLSAIVNKEDFSGIESENTFHGTGE